MEYTEVVRSHIERIRKESGNLKKEASGNRITKKDTNEEAGNKRVNNLDVKPKREGETGLESVLPIEQANAFNGDKGPTDTNNEDKGKLNCPAGLRALLSVVFQILMSSLRRSIVIALITIGPAHYHFNEASNSKTGVMTSRSRKICS